MNSFEFNKIAGAVLFALIVSMLGSLIGEGLLHRDKLEKNIIDIEVAPAGNGAVAEVKELAPIMPLLAKANIENGAAIAKKVCAQCHIFVKGGHALPTGPDLWGIVGRARGSTEFAYSKAMKELGGNWDAETINKFIHKPKDFLSGTKMSFPGLKKDEDRADLIAYLQTLKD
ncbi:MAG: cytochrome c family protein [Candidatus Paracaedibacteraceae bacterium]|nr:cytochrome c family protein [Candidatus Paracaedibacteraceae bacterium]